MPSLPSDLGTALQSLYTQFVLRDVVAKIVPGLLIELGAASLISERDPIQVLSSLRLHGAVVAALFAAAWTLGFVAQTLLDLAGHLPCLRWALRPYARLLRHTLDCIDHAAPPPGRACLDSLQADSESWVDRIARRTNLPGKQQRQLERLAVIKEAAGNLAAAIALFLLLGLWHIDPSRSWWPWLAVGLPVAAVLLARHWDASCREVLLQARFESPDLKPPIHVK